MQRLLHSGLVRNELLSFLDVHDILILIQVSRDFHTSCTANNLALRGRKRALIVPNITTHKYRVEHWNVAWELVTAVRVIGDAQHATPALQPGNVEKLEISLENCCESEIFASTAGLIRLVQAVATVSENFYHMQRVNSLFFDFAEAADDVKVAPLISHLFGMLARLPQIDHLAIAHIPSFASRTLPVAMTVRSLNLSHCYALSLEGAALRQLSSLTLKACCIQNAVAEKLFKGTFLPLLEKLNLADNIITTLRGNLLDCKFSNSLKFVDLSRNRLVDDVESVVEFAKKTEVQKIDISSNMLGDAGFRELLVVWKRLDVGNLTTLVLVHNGVTVCAQMNARQDVLPTTMIFE
jgi:hypothetical protein